MAKKKKTATDVRSAVHAMRDGVVCASYTLRSEPTMKGDDEVETLVKELMQASDRIIDCLNTYYEWD